MILEQGAVGGAGAQCPRAGVKTVFDILRAAGAIFYFDILHAKGITNVFIPARRRRDFCFLILRAKGVKKHFFWYFARQRCGKKKMARRRRDFFFLARGGASCVARTP